MKEKCPLENRLFDQCCCECKHRVEICCHPWNTDIGKGKISERLGWGCMVGKTVFKENQIVFFDREHSNGGCELFEKIDIETAKVQ